MDGGLAGLDDAEKQVFACLNAWRSVIENAESTFRVSRLAIAGAVAWELLENVRTWSPRSTGFGKVHLYNYNFRGTVAEQAESRGYLPKKTYSERKLILTTPEGAITYVAGIMAAIADITTRHGFGDIRNDPVMLTNVYQSKDLDEWEAHLKKKRAGSTLAGGNPMDIWVAKNNAFLTAAVGTPTPLVGVIVPAYVSRPDPKTALGAKTLTIFKNYTLSDIANSEYGSWELWPLIYDRNKAKIGANPNRLLIGVQLSILPFSAYSSKQVADAKRRAPTWKHFK
jgi:hypothetical protein